MLGISDLTFCPSRVHGRLSLLLLQNALSRQWQALCKAAAVAGLKWSDLRQSTSEAGGTGSGKKPTGSHDGCGSASELAAGSAALLPGAYANLILHGQGPPTWQSWRCNHLMGGLLDSDMLLQLTPRREETFLISMYSKLGFPSSHACSSALQLRSLPSRWNDGGR
jgi:hypothetical protein